VKTKLGGPQKGASGEKTVEKTCQTSREKRFKTERGEWGSLGEQPQMPQEKKLNKKKGPKKKGPGFCQGNEPKKTQGGGK